MDLKQFVKDNVRWFSQGCLRIAIDGNVIYTDPYDIDKEYNDADLILLTHSHDDHFSPEDIKKVIKDDTIFILPFAMEDLLDIFPTNPIVCVYPDDALNCEYCKIYAVPAYNIKKVQCHPAEKKWLGYIIELDELSMYYTSDTELIPEMEDIETDIIFLPMGQTYTFNSVADAARAAVITQAELAVPIHYGKFEGSEDDVRIFAELLDGLCEVMVI